MKMIAPDWCEQTNGGVTTTPLRCWDENRFCLLQRNAFAGRLIVTQPYRADFAGSFVDSPDCERVPSQAVGIH
ncbi:hypothetical protein [Bradyrhizobium sp. LTSP885]|uniref:hypothetical protein n=1 Tax=Bradyrhizobium sp. LTSP885 TaxID=1619232 RepID=UPI0012E06FA7|nr:hypothetical protein [Bradyrhizobium sp. LTSP885]